MTKTNDEIKDLLYSSCKNLYNDSTIDDNSYEQCVNLFETPIDFSGFDEKYIFGEYREDKYKKYDELITILELKLTEINSLTSQDIAEYKDSLEELLEILNKLILDKYENKSDNNYNLLKDNYNTIQLYRNKLNNLDSNTLTIQKEIFDQKVLNSGFTLRLVVLIILSIIFIVLLIFFLIFIYNI